MINSIISPKPQIVGSSNFQGYLKCVKEWFLQNFSEKYCVCKKLFAKDSYIQKIIDNFEITQYFSLKFHRNHYFIHCRHTWKFELPTTCGWGDIIEFIKYWNSDCIESSVYPYHIPHYCLIMFNNSLKWSFRITHNSFYSNMNLFS